MKNFIKIILFVVATHGLGYLLMGDTLSFPPDAIRFYAPVAENLVERQGYRLEGHFTNRYPPLFPIFIAGVYTLTGNTEMDNPLFVWFVIILQSLSCGFLYLAAEQIFGKKGGILAGLLFALYPFFMVFSVTKYAWSALPLFMTLFFASLYFFLRKRNEEKKLCRFLSGLLLGLSAITWPAVIYLWCIYIFFILSRPFQMKSKLVLSVCFMAGFIIPVVVWAGEVYRHLGNFQISSAQPLAIRDGLVHKGAGKFLKFELSHDAKKEISDGGLTNITELAVFYARKLSEKPASTLEFVCFKFFRPWYGTDSEQHEEKILWVQTAYLLFAFAGICVSARRFVSETMFLAAVILYFWAIAFIALSILRYMIPSMGILMIFIGGLLSRFFADAKGRSNA